MTDCATFELSVSVEEMEIAARRLADELAELAVETALSGTTRPPLHRLGRLARDQIDPLHGIARNAGPCVPMMPVARLRSDSNPLNVKDVEPPGGSVVLRSRLGFSELSPGRQRLCRLCAAAQIVIGRARRGKLVGGDLVRELKMLAADLRQWAATIG